MAMSPLIAKAAQVFPLDEIRSYWKTKKHVILLAPSTRPDFLGHRVRRTALLDSFSPSSYRDEAELGPMLAGGALARCSTT